MAGSISARTFAFWVASWLFPPGIAFLAAAAVFVPTVQAQAQQTQSPPVGRVIVIGEGSVSVTPDYAQIGSGVTTRAKTVKEATEANSKLMAAIINALLESGVAQRDVQTSRFSIQPIYAPQEPRNEPKLAGYSVSNQVRLKIRQIHKVGEILDRLVTAGATDIGNVEFLVSEPSKALDQAREAAIADARRKAEVYARASGILWICPAGSDAGTGRIGCDGSTSANRQRRGHIASEGHGWFRRCPLIAIRACGDDGEQDEVANPSDIRCTKKPLRSL